jgi:cytosine/adenosine deaminase-related metal-dependent hydrolase
MSRSPSALRSGLWLGLLAVALTLAAAPGFVGCDGAAPETAGTESAFDDEDNDDSVLMPGKADLVNKNYRSGCAGPIRTGSYALKGTVVTPTGILTTGYVVVTDENIAAVVKTASALPAGITVVSTQGIIFPGLIDGHGHVEYNHIKLAELGKRYTNRNQWASAKKYQQQVKDVKAAVSAAKLDCEAVRHGELRALVGGTTAIQGTPSGPCARPLVRNLEQMNFCQDRVRGNVVPIPSFDNGSPSKADSFRADLTAHKLDALVVHCAEGIDETIRGEWATLKSQRLAVPQTVLIHATALTPADLAEVSQIGAKIVWSPLSNLLLYGATTNIPAALDAGVRVSLGADWSPSGSANLLAELKFADRVNQKLWNGRITDEQLYAMVTMNPAISYGLDKHVGSIEVGKAADLLVITKPATTTTVYRALINARPQDVLLVTIAGDPLFGTEAIMTALGKAGDYEVVDACGAPRAIDVTVVAKDVTNASEPLASIESKLATANPSHTPVFDCTDASATAAAAGTPVE